MAMTDGEKALAAAVKPPARKLGEMQAAAKPEVLLRSIEELPAALLQIAD